MNRRSEDNCRNIPSARARVRASMEFWWRSRAPVTGIATSEMVEELLEWARNCEEKEYRMHLNMVEFVDTSGRLKEHTRMSERCGSRVRAEEIQSNLNDAGYTSLDRSETLHLLDAIQSVSSTIISFDSLLEMNKRILGSSSSSMLVASKKAEAGLCALAEQIGSRMVPDLELADAFALAAFAMSGLLRLRGFRDGNKRVAQVVVAVILARSLPMLFPFRVFDTGKQVPSLATKHGILSSMLLRLRDPDEELIKAFTVERAWMAAGLDRNRPPERGDSFWLDHFLYHHHLQYHPVLLQVYALLLKAFLCMRGVVQRVFSYMY